MPGSGGSVSVTRQRRVVPIDAWLADDLRAYLANDHPHGEPASPDYDPSAPLFPGRYGMTEPLSEGFSRDEIEPVRPMVADPAARVSRRTGEPDRRFVRADPHALANPLRAVVGLQMVGAGESCWTGEALFRTGVGGVGI